MTMFVVDHSNRIDFQKRNVMGRKKTVVIVNGEVSKDVDASKVSQVFF